MRLVSIAVLVGALGGVAASAPRGRVVRVDRIRPPAAIPRICMMMMEDRLICVGKPEPRETIHLFETERGKVVGQIRVDSVRDFLGVRPCPGKPPMIFEVTGTLVVGVPDLLDGSRRLVGLRYADLEPGSKLLKNVKPPSAANRDTPTNHQVEMAVDFDGDAGPDYLVEHYPCPDANTSTRSTPTCFDTYMERRGKLELVQRDAIYVCN